MHSHNRLGQIEICPCKIAVGGLVAWVIFLSSCSVAPKSSQATDMNPTAGAFLASTSVGETQFTLNWSAGSNIVTAADSLQYFVCSGASSAAIDSVEECEAASSEMAYVANTLTLTITGKSASTTYYYNVVVKDVDGKRSIYDGKSQATTNSTDSIAPIAGAFSASTGVGAGAFTLNWSAATDVGTAGVSLQYFVCSGGSAAAIDTVAECEAATQEMAYTANTLKVGISGKSSSTTYYFNVVVKDGGANKSLYDGKSQATTADTTAPTAGAFSASTIVAATAFTLNWAAATDNVTAGASLQYFVCSGGSAGAIDTVAECEGGTSELAYTANTLTLAITGKSASTTYYYNVVVKDAANNKSLYDGKSQATTADSTGASLAWTNATTDAHALASLPGTQRNAVYPKVAINSSGRIALAWRQADAGGKYRLYVRIRDGGSWSTSPSTESDTLSLPGGDGVLWQDVAISDNGDIVVAFAQWDLSSGVRLYKAEYRAGSWTKPSSYSDTVANSAGGNVIYANLRVGMWDNGGGIILWNQPTAHSVQNLCYTERNGSGWSSPTCFALSNNSTYYDTYIDDIATNKSGVAVLTYHIPIPVGGGASISRAFRGDRTSGGSWTFNDFDHYFSLLFTLTGFASVSLNDSGTAIIVWSQVDATDPDYPSEEQVWATGALSGSLSRPLLPARAQYPQTCMASNGNYLVTFGSDTTFGSYLYPPSPVSSADVFHNGFVSYSGYATYCKMSTSYSVLMWVERRLDDTFGIFKATKASGGSWIKPSGSSDAISFANLEATFPVMAMNASDQAIIAWVQSRWVDQNDPNQGAYTEIRITENR